MSDREKRQNDGASEALYGQIARFAAVGAAATCAHYVVALLASNGVNVYGANLLGYLAAVGISYVGHQRYSFRVDVISHKRQLPRFVLGSLTGLALSYIALAIARDVFGAPDWLSLAAAVSLVPVYTFFFNKLYVFRSRIASSN